VPVRFYGNGTDTTVVFQHTYSGQEFAFTLPFVADSAVFDPELWILSNNNTMDQTLSVSALHVDNAFECWPNPAHDELVVRPQNDAERYRWSILSATGAMISSGNGQGRQRIPLQSIAPGVYLVRLTTANGKVETQRIVVE
jgi:Secretion system C-terminal sorting domain